MNDMPPFAAPFQAVVYGTIFGKRTSVVHRLREGDRLILVPDPPGVESRNVWVHASGGDVVGHLRPDIGGRLAVWMSDGGRCRAEVGSVGSDDVASWRRLVITIWCLHEDSRT
ncbi:MAG: hypothetical protein NVS1B4_14650 [Gemmatimonadaceae bacterium]